MLNHAFPIVAAYPEAIAAVATALCWPRKADPSNLRPEFLTGREGLLAGLHALMIAGPEPRTVALCGLGGAGKTSTAVEYAHRHLAETSVCWQLSADDPAILEAEFAVLAAQFGARDLADARDPVASVHAVLARQETGWLLIFDNAPGWESVERFLPPAGHGRVLITTQSQPGTGGLVLGGAVAAIWSGERFRK